MGEQEKKSWWQKNKQLLLIAVITIVLFVFVSGAYIFKLSWTGFNGGYDKITKSATETIISKEQQPAKTLWDWLQLFIIPTAIAFGGLWFTKTQRKAERDAEVRAEQKILLRKLDSNIIQAYNSAKKVRRLLRATSRCYPPRQRETMIIIEPYDKQMQALIDVQLQFETFRDEVESNSTLFSGKANLCTLKCQLKSIEDYLHAIISEYEELYTERPKADGMLPIAKLPRLREFIERNSKKQSPNKTDFQEPGIKDFQTDFQEPAHKVMGTVLNLLISEQSNQTESAQSNLDKASPKATYQKEKEG